VSPAIRVILVDDQELVRTGFRMILEDQPDIEVVGEAADGKDGVDVAQRLQPDVVVMDIRMPVLDGIAATRRIVRDGIAPQARVLILTTFDADENVVGALVVTKSLADANATARVAWMVMVAIGIVAVGFAWLIASRLSRRLARPIIELAESAANTGVGGVLAVVFVFRGDYEKAFVAAAAGAVLLSMLVGTSRVMLGVHWPSDVIGGWAFGMLWVLLTLRLAGRLIRE